MGLGGRGRVVSQRAEFGLGSHSRPADETLGTWKEEGSNDVTNIAVQWSVDWEAMGVRDGTTEGNGGRCRRGNETKRQEDPSTQTSGPRNERFF